MLDDMLALANSACLLALSRSGRHVLALLLCAGLVAPCCAVFAVDTRQQLVHIFKKAHNNKRIGKRRLLSSKTIWKLREKASRQVIQ